MSCTPIVYRKKHPQTSKYYCDNIMYDFSHIADYLLNSAYGVADPFMCLADYESYMNAHACAVNDYKNKELWAKKSLTNTAMSGIFSSDNSITQYAKNIWHTEPVNEK